MEVDRVARTLRYYNNGVDQGVAVKELPPNTTFSAAVSLYEEGDSVTFVRQSKWQRATDPISNRQYYFQQDSRFVLKLLQTAVKSRSCVL